jgi:MFS family permease
MHNVQPSFVSAGSPDLDDASPCSAAKSCDLKQAKGLGRRAQAWVVMGLAAIFLFYKYILQVSPGVMASSLMHDFHLHGMGLGHLAAVYFYAFVVVQLFSGVLLDRYSPRKVTSVAIGVAACGALMFACAHTLWLAVLARALIGVGVAFATVSYLKQASLYCGRSSAGWVSGLLATAVGLGALVGEAPIAYSTTQWGWRLTLVGCALLGGVIALLYWCCARDAKPVSVAPKPLRMDKKTLAGVVFKPCNLWLMLYSGLAFSPLAVFSGLWGNGYLQVAYHLNSTQAAAYITLSFVGLGLGAPLFGYVSDRLQKRCVVMVCGTVLSVHLFVWFWHRFFYARLYFG